MVWEGEVSALLAPGQLFLQDREDLLRREDIELTKSVRGPPGWEELRARSRRLRAPAMSGSNEGRETLKSTRHAMGRAVSPYNDHDECSAHHCG